MPYLLDDTSWSQTTLYVYFSQWISILAIKRQAAWEIVHGIKYSQPAKKGSAKKKTVGDKKCIRSAGPAPRHIRGEVGLGRA